MAYYDLISENDESTVVASFEQGTIAAEAPYMSEKNLEDRFVAQLGMQEYDFVSVTTEAYLPHHHHHHPETRHTCEAQQGNGCL